MKTRLATINLEVANPELSKRFYMEVMGMEEDTSRSHPPGFVYLRSEGCDLTLACTRDSSGGEPSRTMELGFEVRDIGGVKDHLAAHGVRKFREESMGWGSAVELHDTDGHRVLIYAFRAEADEADGPEGGPPPAR